MEARRVDLRLAGRPRDAGFTDRHPELVSSKGTIQLRPGDADALDDELRDLFRAALGGPPDG